MLPCSCVVDELAVAYRNLHQDERCHVLLFARAVDALA